MPTTVAAQSGRRRPMLSVPKQPKRQRQAKGPSEFQIHAAVVSNLQWRGRDGVFWFHPANGNKRSKAEAGKLKAMGVVAGVPDLIIICDGALYGLEIKADKGKTSPAQRVVHDRLTDAGATIAVTCGLDGALAQLDAWEMFR